MCKAWWGEFGFFLAYILRKVWLSSNNELILPKEKITNFYMPIQTNQSLSVDCVLFGFDGTSLRVLLIERPAYNNLERMKLPGSMIQQNETLPEAAVRVNNI